MKNHNPIRVILGSSVAIAGLALTFLVTENKECDNTLVALIGCISFIIGSGVILDGFMKPLEEDEI